MEKKEPEDRKSHSSESEKLVREFIANMVHGVEAAIQSNTLDVKLLGDAALLMNERYTGVLGNAEEMKRR